MDQPQRPFIPQRRSACSLASRVGADVADRPIGDKLLHVVHFLAFRRGRDRLDALDLDHCLRQPADVTDGAEGRVLPGAPMFFLPNDVAFTMRLIDVRKSFA